MDLSTCIAGGGVIVALISLAVSIRAKNESNSAMDQADETQRQIARLQAEVVDIERDRETRADLASKRAKISLRVQIKSVAAQRRYRLIITNTGEATAFSLGWRIHAGEKYGYLQNEHWKLANPIPSPIAPDHSVQVTLVPLDDEAKLPILMEVDWKDDSSEQRRNVISALTATGQ